MKRGDLTDDELRECIMGMPTFDGIDERLIELFTELVGKYASQISMKEFSDEGMYGLLMRRQGLQNLFATMEQITSLDFYTRQLGLPSKTC